MRTTISNAGRFVISEADLRARWLRLIREELPAAACTRPDWPIWHDHCFARVVLDNICGRPWRDVIPAPAWRRMDPATLAAAIALAEAVLADQADMAALNQTSLMLRDKFAGP